MHTALHHLMTFALATVVGALTGWALAVLDTRVKRRGERRRGTDARAAVP